MFVPNRGQTQPSERILRLGTLKEDESLLQPPELVVANFGYRGRVALLVAGEKQGKTTLMTEVASALSAGREALGGEASPKRRIVWLGVEEHLADVVSRFSQHDADDDEVYILAQAGDPREDYLYVLEHLQPDLLVVDTLHRFLAGSPEVPESNDPIAWNRVMEWLIDPVRSSRTAVVFLHHAKRNSAEYIGAQALGGQVDIIAQLTKENDPFRRLLVEGRYGCSEFEVRLVEGDPPHFEKLGPAGSLGALIVDFVAAHPGCTKTQLRQGVSGSSERIDAALRLLLDDGRLVDRNHGSKAMRLFAPVEELPLAA